MCYEYMSLYITSTPSPYTREEVKVTNANYSNVLLTCLNVIQYITAEAWNGTLV